MSTVNSTPSERAAVLAALVPDERAAGAVNTPLIPLALFYRLQAIIQVGALGTSATVNAKLQGAVGAAGTPVDIPGAAITALTQAGADSGKVAIINLNSDSLAPLGYTHVRLVLTVGVAASDTSAILLGFDPRYAPASDNDATVVDEIVSV